MRRAHLHACLSVGALTLIGFAPPTDAPPSRQCAGGVCTVRLTPLQLLRNAEKAARERQFGAAKAMLTALAQAPELKVERSFLNGYVAAETGDLPQAAQYFRAVLRDRPDIVRARLELARVLMLQGKDSAADHHFRLAEEAKDLPPEIAQTIRGARGVIRQRKPWYINVNAGLAPDSNVNNATDAESIDIPFGDEPLRLDDDARRKSGTGQFATVSAGVRLRLSDGLAMVVDADGSVVNQRGTAADDVSALLAAGPELTMTNGARIGIQATGVQRWYGGRSATTGGGVRLSYQQNLNAGARLGVQVESRRIHSGFSDMYGGWQHSAYGSYERVVRTSMIASAGLFVRRDDLRSAAFSNTEVGATLGIGGELPHGINAGLSGGVSRAVFDAPVLFLSNDPRRDWRFNARAYVGARSLRLLGFSPSVTYTFNHTDSNVALYETSRHRFAFGLARYF